MADIELVVKIPEEDYAAIMSDKTYQPRSLTNLEWKIANGTPLPKGHSFIAICDSDYPITEEVKQELKNTVFVGDEDCNYCFDMTEIIEVDKEEKWVNYAEELKDVFEEEVEE